MSQATRYAKTNYLGRNVLMQEVVLATGVRGADRAHDPAPDESRVRPERAVRERRGRRHPRVVIFLLDLGVRAFAVIEGAVVGREVRMPGRADVEEAHVHEPVRPGALVLVVAVFFAMSAD